MKKKIALLEDGIHNLIEKYLFHIGVALLILISILIRWHMAPITVLSGDYNSALLPWVEYYRENGIIKGLAESMGSYYVPYNLFLAIVAYLPGEPWIYISLLSIIFEYISAVAIYLIAKEILGNGQRTNITAIMIAVVTLFLPATILNSSLWKQCDSIYTCFLIISIYYAIKKRYSKSLLMLSIGFIFKLQAIYLFPLFVILYIKKEKGLSILHFFWIPIMYLVGGVPAILAGRRVMDVYDCYYHQASYAGFDAMEIGMPNIYGLGLSDYPALSMPAILITLCIFIFMACELQKYKNNLTNKNILYISIWVQWACIMFLPAQHERYNYPVLILLVVYYMLDDIRKCWPAVVITIISCIQYSYYLFAEKHMDYHIMSICHIVAFIYVTYDLIRNVKEQR